MLVVAGLALLFLFLYKGAGTDELPSELKYEMFKDSKSGTCTAKDSRPVCNETLIGKVKAGLRKFQINNGDDKLAKEIVGNCHYACNREETDSSGKWCYLFYYWLGSTIKGNLGNQHSYTPDKVMKAIYQELQGKCECNNECTNLYDDISSWQTFEEGKKLFDYYYNNSALPGYPDCDKIISGRKYTKLRSDAEEAYDTLDGICDSSNRDKYCTEFRANRDQWNPQKLPEPKCNNERKPKEDEEDEVDKFLPSSNAYKTLEISQKLYKAEALVSIIETYIRSAVHNHTENPNCIDEIASAWYCVNMVISKQSTYSKDERCNFFYYWLGHMLNGKLKNTSKFGEVMNEIYAGLSQFTDEDVCPKVQTNIDITLFNRRKIVFDYWYNYKTMRTQWESPEFHCDSSYKAYFDRALSAYNDVQTDCDNNEKNKHGSYCLKFSGQYGDYNPHILINGKCTNPPKRKEYLVAQDQPQQETPPAEGTSGATTGVVAAAAGSSAGSGASIAPAAVSATLPIVGLPTILFFLYKYTPFSSWISNTFFGGRNNNNKRSRRRWSTERNFTTLPDDSTEYGTEYSTESSINDSMEESTVYNMQPVRRTNNKQQQQRQQRNIAYPRM